MSSLQKKLEALEAALGSPRDTAAGFARRLIRESPAPSLLSKTPTLSSPAAAGNSHEIDLDTSADLFSTPEVCPLPKRPKHDHGHRKNRENAEFRVPSKPLGSDHFRSKTKAHSDSAVAKAGGRNPVGAGISTFLQNVGNKSTTAAVGGILRKSGSLQLANAVGASLSSVFREGYNGLGGHEKVIIPPSKPAHSVVVKKPANSRQMRKFFGPSKTAQTPPPPLPSLDADAELLEF